MRKSLQKKLVNKVSEIAYIKNGEIVIEGTFVTPTERKYHKRCGEFHLSFENGEEITIPHVSKSWPIYRHKHGIIKQADLYNAIFFVFQKTEKDIELDELFKKELQRNYPSFFTLLIYKGPRFIDKIDNICEDIQLSCEVGRFAYTTAIVDEIGEYEYWLYDKGLRTSLGKGPLAWGGWQLHNNSYPEYNCENQDGSLNLIYHIDGSKANSILHSYCVSNADKLTQLPNCFPDDGTRNYIAEFKPGKDYELSFVKYCMLKCLPVFSGRSSCLSYAIYNVAIHEYNKVVRSDFWLLSDKEISSKRALLEDIFIQSGEPFDVGKLPDIIPYASASPHAQYHSIESYVLNHCNDYSDEDYEKTYNTIYKELLESGEIKGKWKTEYSVFEIVSKAYPDAIYQYHAKWLRHQSLDVFIPSENIGIEYQGEQHYQPLEVFGGKAHYERQVELDAQKRKLCLEHNIKLIEIKYDEIISWPNIKKKIDKANNVK